MELWKLILIFSALQLINVVMQTCKSIITIKGTRLQSALMNAIAFMVYTIVVIYMVADFALWIKVVIVGATNFIGVYISNWILAKCHKDRLWEVTATIKNEYAEDIQGLFNNANISYNCFAVNKNEYIFNIFSYTQEDSIKIKQILSGINAKYVVHEENASL